MYYVLSTVVTELVLILPYFEGAVERSSLEIIFKLTLTLPYLINYLRIKKIELN